MKILIKFTLRFLFPEMQIIDAIKQEGFITKKQKQVVTMNTTNNTVVGNTVLQSSTSSNSRISSNKINAPKAEAVSSNVAIGADRVDAKFDGVEQQLRQSWIASEKNISALCQSFKRPFVMGVNSAMPKNTILVVGNESRGKVKAISDMCVLLKQKRVFRYSEVSVVEFERYPTSSEDELFLSDLYKALYSQSEVVVFENIDKANFHCLDVVFQLMKNGTYHLAKRYVLQNNMLVDSTGMLNTVSISELNTNGKYFVFTSTCSVKKVTEYVGNEFARLINDIIVLDEFSQLELKEVVDRLLIQFTAKVKKQLQITVQIDPSCIEEILCCYDVTKGVNSLMEVIEEKLYKPLSEYRLQYSTQEE